MDHGPSAQGVAVGQSRAQLRGCSVQASRKEHKVCTEVAPDENDAKDDGTCGRPGAVPQRPAWPVLTRRLCPGAVPQRGVRLRTTRPPLSPQHSLEDAGARDSASMAPDPSDVKPTARAAAPARRHSGTASAAQLPRHTPAAFCPAPAPAPHPRVLLRFIN